MTRLLAALALCSMFLPNAFGQEAAPDKPTAEPAAKPEPSHAVVPLPDTPGERPDAPRPDLVAAAKAIRERTNGFRKEQGREPVTADERLTKTAKAFAAFMASKHVYGHEADGRTPADRVTDHGYEYCGVRENIAFAFDEAGFETERLAETFFTGWKDSPEHRENMLASEVVETGVGIAQDSKSGKYFAVQLFGRPLSREYSFTVVNETETTIRYRVGDRGYDLRPRFTQTHAECVPRSVAFLPSGESETPLAKFAVTGGERLVATESGEGYAVEKSAKTDDATPVRP